MTNTQSDNTKVALDGFGAIIELLADGGFHSGEEIGRLLGMSRSAVWKRLQQLQSVLGVRFESIRGRGYRLIGGVELLRVERVKSALSSTALRWLQEIELHGQIDSTNRRARQLAQSGVRSGVVVVAEHQTAGSGRRGRQWVSPFGRNIYYSSLWTFGGGIGALEGLSLVVGMVVARVITPLTDSGVQLKWPNDVLIDGKKIAGVLLEIIGDIDGSCTVIIGVGINVNMTGASEAEDIDQAWGDVSSVARSPVSRNGLLSSLISEMVDSLRTFEREGFKGFRDEWDRLDYLKGKVVTIADDERSQRGEVLGLDDSGALLVKVEGVVRALHGGEVSVRPQR